MNGRTPTGRESVAQTAPGARAGVETDSEWILDVIHAFDDILLGDDTSVDDVLVVTARCCHGVAGIVEASCSREHAMDASGSRSMERPDERASALLSDGSEVWFARSELSAARAEFLLGRAVVTIGALLRRPKEVRQIDPGTALETALSAGVDSVDRSRALRTLGLASTHPLVTVAYDGPLTSDAALLAALPDKLVLRAGRVGGLLCVVLSGKPDHFTQVPKGGRMGIGRAERGTDLPEAWRQARTALRYSLPSPHGGPERTFTEAIVVDFDDVGAWTIVADHLPSETLRVINHPDVDALDRLVAQSGGEEMRRTLETVSATGSIRQAATVLHLHHNSVAHRLARAEAELGFPINVPYGRSRLLVALIIQRLRDNV